MLYCRILLRIFFELDLRCDFPLTFINDIFVDHTSDIAEWINADISADDRTGIQYRIAANLGVISDDCTEFAQLGIHFAE